MFDDAADLFLFIEGDDFPETNSLIRGERNALGGGFVSLRAMVFSER
jgi:hypothetical protein